MEHEPQKQAEGIGESEAFLDFQERLSRVAKVDRPVLIVGERGSGKELAVHRLHYLSGRWQGPLIALNAAALAPGVLESELFGHEAGAFTGASKRRQGRFEAADGGSLFLDEIGLVPLQVQEKILRVVEYREFERVGASEKVRVDVRIIGATNADLPAMAAAGKFKHDLLDRLSFEVLFLPSLRDRREDIMLLAHHFAARMATELGWREIPGFSERAVALLENYNWPGNIRELKNVVERAVYCSEGRTIDAIVFNPFERNAGSAQTAAGGGTAGDQPAPATPGIVPAYVPGQGNLLEAIDSFERSALRAALSATQFHQGQAAELLGMSYHQFRGLYRKHRDKLG
jgi:psp operon transcriptional activator